MTGFDIFDTAIIRLGLIGVKGSIEQEIPYKSTAISVINELSADLCDAKPISNLNDKLDISEKAAIVISYGLAYFLAVIMGEEEKEITMNAIFKAKRSLYLSEIKTVTDKTPNILEV